MILMASPGVAFSLVCSNFCRFSLSGRCTILKKGQLLKVATFSRFHSQWHLVGALCLERKPVVSRELLPFEKEFRAFLDKEELDNSLLSDHELRGMKDLMAASEPKDKESSFQNTAQDDEDSYVEELNKFNIAPRVKGNDEKDDNKDLRRHLDKSLVLLVKQKLGNDARWGLPQAVREEGETMKQVAERVCKEICGNGLEAVVTGNAPVGYCKYKYPKAARNNGVLGAKVFFFKAWYLKGNVNADTFNKHPEAEDYMWATCSELATQVTPKDYRKNILSFLVEGDVITDRESSQEEENSDLNHREQARATN